MRITEVDNPENKILVGKTTRNKIISPDIIPPLPNKNATWIIDGVPNSGKSCLINSFLKRQYKKCFHAVFLVCPETSRSCFGKNSALTKADPKKTYNELTPETIDKIYEQVVETRDEGDAEGEQYYSLLILDDVQASLKDEYVEKQLRAMLSNYRHLNLSVWVCVQNYLSLSRQCRLLFLSLIHI